MKFLSFLISLLLHVLFALVFILIVRTSALVVKKAQVYNVNLIVIKENNQKSKVKVNSKTKYKHETKHKTVYKKVSRKHKPKNKSHILKKPIKKKQKPKPKPKPKEKPKKQVGLKPNIEKKIRLMKEKIMIQRIKQNLLREKIREIKERVLSEEEAKKSFSEKLARSYIALIESLIYKNWGVAKDIVKNNVFITKVEIKLDYRGNLIKLYMVKSSKNAYFDGTVMNAIKLSEPFPPPPKEILSGGAVDFIITFDSREKE